MKSLSVSLIISAVAGLLGGLFLGGVTDRNSQSSTGQNAAPDRVAVSSRSLRALDSSSKFSHPRSDDTLESLLTAPPDELYSRLALWLMTADEAEIAAYWDHFITGDEQPRPILDLIMIGWTRVNPEGAIAAVKGSPYEHFAWWASTCHDPARALQFALAEKTEHLSSVMWGLGEFHPKWVREKWDTLPEDSRGGTIPGIVKWAPTDDPMATVEFLKGKSGTPPVGMIRYLVRQDPQAAYDWFAANASEIGTQYQYAISDQASSLIGHALAKDAPELLDEIIAKTPPGMRRFQLESAVIAELAKGDPDAALARARANSDPALASCFMAKAGLHLTRSDPDRAFDLMAEILEKSPNALLPLELATDDGKSLTIRPGMMDTGALLRSLEVQDPARTAQTLFSLENAGAYAEFAATVTQNWGLEDLPSLEIWADQNPGKLDAETKFRTAVALSETGRYQESLDWSIERQDEGD